MAFPTPTYQTGTLSVTSGTSLDLPDDIAAGDLVVLAAMIPSANNVGLTQPSGYSTVLSLIQNPACQVFSLFAAGGETSVSLSTGNGSARGVAYWVAKFDGSAHGSSAPAGGTAASHDPPSLNPGAWDVEDTLWLAMCCSIDHANGVTSKPSDYTLYSFNGQGYWIVGKENAAASEDPGSFGGSFDCTAATVAIRPAAVAHVPQAIVV